MANPSETPELFYRNSETATAAAALASERDSSWDDMPPGLLEALGLGTGSINDSAADTNGVAELLVGQTETADVLLLNKVDLLDEERDRDKLNQIEQICRALNPKATILKCQYGQVPMNQILAVAGGIGVVEAGVVDDHRDAVEAATTTLLREKVDNVDNVIDTVQTLQLHDHDHDHNSGLDTRLSSDHHHSHEHSHTHEDCTDPDCTDSSHTHTHDHNVNDCVDADCTDPSHSHAHDHTTACADPDCNDPSHQHSHDDHQHAGIGSFVYRARRPFHPGRLLAFLKRLPVVRGLPEGEADEHAIKFSDIAEKAIQELLRSKGFSWCADSNIAALYWSQAGSSFEMQCLGRWWATLPREQWPSDAVPVILADFDDEKHREDDQTTVTVGDRRQEIVFIGQQLDRRSWQVEICNSLDQCLLTDDEWYTYQQIKGDENALRLRFANPVKSRMLTF